MRPETFTLGPRELQRVAVISYYVERELACARAAELLALPPRQVKRLNAVLCRFVAAKCIVGPLKAIYRTVSFDEDGRPFSADQFA